MEESKVTLHLGDCFDVLRTLKPGNIDAIVTDPPYGVGFKYSTHKDNRRSYHEFLWPRVELAESLCAAGSPVFVWQASKHIKHFNDWFPREWRIFVAARNYGQVLPGMMYPAYEPIVCWWTPGEAWTDKSKCLRDFALADTNPGIASRKKRGDYIKGHPCPRPLFHVQYMIERWVRPGGTVLDLFMGSGTTGAACVRTGRNFVGIELDPDYFEVARKRIEEEQARLAPDSLLLLG